MTIFGYLGGEGYGAYGSSPGYLNDLWRYDGVNWTWVAGSNSTNSLGTPIARVGSGAWLGWDNKTLFLFGGLGVGGDMLNDLWKFDGQNWTFVLGSNYSSQASYNTSLGIASPLNNPGGRSSFIALRDIVNKIVWIFGGIGNDSTGTTGMCFHIAIDFENRLSQ